MQASVKSELFKVQFTTIEGDLQEGPLGLLWRLIESYEVDIFQVSMSRITADFIAYLNSGKVKLEEEAEFVLMASRLLFYKSRLLLPNPGFEEEQEPDTLPFELVDQLLEYKKFQMAAEALKEIEEKTQMSFIREASWEEYEKDLDLLEVDMVTFLKSFKTFLINQELKNPYQIQEEEVSMDQVIEGLMTTLENKHKVMFFSYIENFSINKVVVTFLAILELVKLRLIHAVQNYALGDIELVYMAKKENPAEV